MIRNFFTKTQVCVSPLLFSHTRFASLRATPEERVFFTFIDQGASRNSTFNKTDEPIGFDPNAQWNNVLHTAAEQFGYESDAWIEGAAKGSNKKNFMELKISRKLTAKTVRNKYGPVIKIYPRVKELRHR